MCLDLTLALDAFKRRGFQTSRFWLDRDVGDMCSHSYTLIASRNFGLCDDHFPVSKSFTRLTSSARLPEQCGSSNWGSKIHLVISANIHKKKIKKKKQLRPWIMPRIWSNKRHSIAVTKPMVMVYSAGSRTLANSVWRLAVWRPTQDTPPWHQPCRHFPLRAQDILKSIRLGSDLRLQSPSQSASLLQPTHTAPPATRAALVHKRTLRLSLPRRP